MFTTTDPYDDLAWSNVIWPQTAGYTIDPDIFFDDDGSVVIASAGEPIIAAYLDLATGNTSEPWELWAGTGGQSAEGPHIYKRDGYYYLLIAEGGTQLNHSATMARSKSLKGPWEAAPHNPLVSNRGTDNYFQTVGHADLFQDAHGNWWGVALSTRGGHENTLRLTASRANLTTDLNFNTSTEGVTALFRRQEHTYFNFSVDIQLGFGKSSGDEMGISHFGTPDQHADLGIVYLEDVSESAGKLKPYLRVRARSVNAFTAPEPTTTPVPEGATTFRLKANGLVIFLDTWLEKPSVLTKYLDVDNVTEADYIFISHAHFDHLPGADRIAKKTGAIVIANGEAINLLRSAGVHESQLFPVAGGERIPMFTKADRDAAVAGKIPLANGPPGAPARPHHSRAVMSVHVWPSLHALMPGSGHHDIPDEIDTGTEYTGEATPYVCTLDVTTGMKYALMRLKEIIPPDQMDEGTRSMADYMEDRDRHVFSNYDGGQLAYNFLIGPRKTLFWNGHLGGYEGILKAIEPAPDVAILAIAGRANLNGRPYNGKSTGVYMMKGT
ncbi:xylosidase arabinofuranosidase [Colletotrichum sp. SAR11_240]|nr:xylosidase arabinofuranosidase [Colletotrichum sp. SAR11_240]